MLPEQPPVRRGGITASVTAACTTSHMIPTVHPLLHMFNPNRGRGRRLISILCSNSSREGSSPALPISNLIPTLGKVTVPGPDHRGPSSSLYMHRTSPELLPAIWADPTPRTHATKAMSLKRPSLQRTPFSIDTTTLSKKYEELGCSIQKRGRKCEANL